MNGDRMNKKGNVGVIAIITIITFIAIVWILCAGFDSVDASHIGVMNEMGTIKGTMEPGIRWTGLFTDVYQYDLRTRKMQIVMNGDEGAVDKDGQSIFATIEINYHFKKEAAIDGYSKIGKDNEIADKLNIEGIVREGFKSTTSEYSSLDIFQKRQEVKEKSIEKISKNFPDEYFVLDNVIISNIDFNDAFKAAIEQKKVAEELAKAREQEVKVAKFDADKKIEEARGVSESAKLQADANAYLILKNAEAEAKALEMKREQLTPLMIQQSWIEAWNGQLPQYVLGDSMNMWMSMPGVGAN